MRPAADVRALCTRRGALLATALALTPPPARLAAATPPQACSLSQLGVAQQILTDVERLLPERSSWVQAQSRLESLEDATLQRSLAACVDPKTLKETAMNNAAFIVYYEERRYNDLRLEPEVPSLRAEQNGRIKELTRALADERAELAFLLKSPDEDAADLRAYSATARKALADFIALVPTGANAEVAPPRPDLR